MTDLLKKHATPRQLEYLEAVEKHGGVTAAAVALGLHHSSVAKSLQRLEKRAATIEPKLHAHTAPEGYHLRGASTMLNAAGQPVLTWVKTAKSAESPEAFLSAFQAALEERQMPAAPPVPQPMMTSKELLTVYPMGDPHFGMLAWGTETGEDFDIIIAERHLVAAVDRLVSLAPHSEQALIVNLGDFFHADNQDARTARSGHSLDVDSRWAKVLKIGITTMVRCIDRALEKHTYVRVINEVGNHDDHTSIMLSICLAHHYRDNPRVEIDVNPGRYHWFEFGLNLFGITHGHGAKARDLPGIMAHDKPEAWGRTRFRYWLCGHVHHESKKEYPGCVVETYRTLAAKDAWHHAEGYRSRRAMVCDVHHATRGRILRHEVGVEELDHE